MNSRTIVTTRQDQALAMYEAGKSVTQIAARLGYHRATIINGIRAARSRREAGVHLPPVDPALRAPTPPRPAYIPRKGMGHRPALAAKYRAMGYSWSEVARLSGYRSHSSALEAARRAKVESLSVGT